MAQAAHQGEQGYPRQHLALGPAADGGSCPSEEPDPTGQMLEMALLFTSSVSVELAGWQVSHEGARVVREVHDRGRREYALVEVHRCWLVGVRRARGEIHVVSQNAGDSSGAVVGNVIVGVRGRELQDRSDGN